MREAFKSQVTEWHELKPGIRYRMNIGTVELDINYTCNFAEGWNSIGTLPDGFRPSETRYSMTAVDYSPAKGYLNAEGELRVYCTKAFAKQGVQ